MIVKEKDAEKIIKENGRIISHIISGLNIAPHIEYKDLFQLGQIAVFESIRTYKEGMGKKFSSYAYSAVRGKLLNYLKDNALSFGRPRGKIERLNPEERHKFIYENRPVSLHHIDGSSREVNDDKSMFEDAILQKVLLEECLTPQQLAHYKLLAEGLPYRTVAKKLKYTAKHEIDLREKLFQKLRRLEEKL